MIWVSLVDKIKLLLIVGTLSCASQKELKYGSVIEKVHIPFEVYQIPISYFDLNKKEHITKYKDVIDDDDYIIKFTVYNGKKRKTKIVHVRKEVYDSLNIGDLFDPTKIPYSRYDRYRR